MYDSERIFGEPTLEEMLTDPTIALLMRRDDVRPGEIRTLAKAAGRAGDSGVEDGRTAPSASERGPDGS